MAYNELIDEHLSKLLASYRRRNFSKDMRTYILGLPRRKLGEVTKALDGYLLRGEIPGRIRVFIRDLVRFRNSPGHNTDHLNGQAGNKRFSIWSNWACDNW